jgi:hypothetical protein
MLNSDTDNKSENGDQQSRGQMAAKFQPKFQIIVGDTKHCAQITDGTTILTWSFVDQ